MHHQPADGTHDEQLGIHGNARDGDSLGHFHQNGQKACADDRKDRHLNQTRQTVGEAGDDPQAGAVTHLDVLRNAHRFRNAESLNAEPPNAEQRHHDRDGEDLQKG